MALETLLLGRGVRPMQSTDAIEVEMTHYRLPPGRRAAWTHLWDASAKPAFQHPANGYLLGEFLSYQDDNLFVTIRAHRSAEERLEGDRRLRRDRRWLALEADRKGLGVQEQSQLLRPAVGSPLRTPADLERVFPAGGDDPVDGRVLELRTYRVAAGKRPAFAEFFADRTVAAQRACGIPVLGQFESVDDDTTFVWLRSFPDLEERDRRKAHFYDGRYWKDELEETAFSLIEDYSNVLLLYPRRGSHLR